jgi:micrococcal nuclease
MHRAARPLVLVALALTLVLSPAATAQDEALHPPADAEVAVVVDVIDGDTIRVERGGGGVERVRYIGIDTPEVASDGQPAEPWADEAAAANADLVTDQFVTLERDVSDRDQFDRLLRYVWVQHPEGWLMVNGELVAQGLAEAVAYEPDTSHHAWLEELEAQARSAGIGMHGIEPSAGERNLVDDILDFLFGS